MHILFCNERFLFRFGLDRVLIIFGKGLKESGHTISIMANIYDRDVLETVASTIIDIPEVKNDYLNSNELTETWIKNNWNKIFNDLNKPDVIVVGGWPFFSSISFFKKMGIPVIFLDCGAVPLEGYTNGMLVIQKKLRDMRRKYLRDATSIIAISDFIATTQSKTDTDTTIPISTILLGADHLDMKIWGIKDLDVNSPIICSFNKIKKAGKQCILNLGRWEPNCYKNSEAIFDIMRKIHLNKPDSILFVLAPPSTIQVPPDLQNCIYPIGFPNDAELGYLMKYSDLGISTSLWEGFNLPLAEMQWLDVPVLVFNKGAHPEVILHPWYLCNTHDEMTVKACEILNGNDLSSDKRKKLLAHFQEFFTWKRATSIFNETLENFQKIPMKQDILAIIDVTNAVRDPANSGVIRVTRRISHELQRYISLLFVVWDNEKREYFLPTKAEFNQLSQFNGPVLSGDCKLSSKERKESLSEYLKTSKKSKIWLIFTETIDEGRARIIRKFARDNHIFLAAIFYDAIPVLYPEFCQDISVRNNHSHYMTGLAECDLIIPISEFSSKCLQNFWKESNIKGCNVRCNLLPGEFGGYKRNTIIQNPNCDQINILCVSTLEPRKNHKTLINACLLMQKEHPELNWTLTLVGNRYAGAFNIADEIQKISRDNPRIQWRGVVSDHTLNLLYKDATFTVYPSIIEGFGMPILESFWQGKPVICSNKGVMSELAADGGCLTTDILNERILSTTIYQLCTDNQLLYKLSCEAVNRKIKTWDEYTQKFLTLLNSESIFKDISKDCNMEFNSTDTRTWEEILYPNCLCEHWQMNNSERMALTTILSRHNPQCSIEIGTYKGGSLSLLSQFSKMVFSINKDPTASQRFSFFKNVTFLTGLSQVSLPLLLKSLDYEQVPVDFILIDGDHSADEVKNDLNLVLSYIPKKPLFVIIHNSFNPECRRGILSADWNSCPYVQWADIDFVPGCIIENGSASDGEMWGGLALIFMTPAHRKSLFNVECNANSLFNIVHDNINRK